MGSTPYAVALFRAAIGAFFTAGVVFFTAAPMGSDRTAIYSAGAAAFSYLAVRFAGEGTFDTRSGAQKAVDEHKAIEDAPEPHVVLDALHDHEDGAPD